MKCEKHPETDAVGACVSCGRGVCPICKLSYNNMLHCKECIEAGRVGGHQYSNYWGAQGGAAGQAPGSPYGSPYGGAPAQASPYGGAPAQGAYPYSYGYYPYSYYPSYYGYGTYGMVKATPQPKGIPNGSLFKIGTAGCIFLAIVGLIQGFMVMNITTMSQQNNSQTLIVGSIVLMMAMFPFGLGIFGFYKNYGSVWGVMGSLSILICSVLYPVLLYMAVLYARQNEYSYSLDSTWMYMAHMTLGIGLIMAGLAINQAKRYFEVERQVQGMMTFGTAGLAIGGILFCAFIGMYLVGWIAMAVSLFMLSMEFYNAPVPDMKEEEEKMKSDFFNPDAPPKPGGASPTPMAQPTPMAPAEPMFKTNPSYATAPEPAYQPYDGTGKASGPEEVLEVQAIPPDHPVWSSEKRGY